MHIRNTLIYSLLLSCSLFVVTGQSAAQLPPYDCTPVVYVFRHAEDVNGPPPHLTNAGYQHADVYPQMITEFGNDHHYCPVGFVYATNDTLPDGSGGTRNPYLTAEPMADLGCGNLALTFTRAAGSYDPVYPLDLEKCGARLSDPSFDGASFPHMALRSGGKLYEYVGEGLDEKAAKAGRSATFDELLGELLANVSFVSQFGISERLSSAIFWTSQGMKILGEAIVPNFEGIPGCSKPKKDCNPKALRNSIYIFQYKSGAFNPPTPVDQFVQCFNVNRTKLQPGSTYYCSTAGILPEGIKDPATLRGKICDTTNMAPDCVKLAE